MQSAQSTCDELYSKSTDPWGFRTRWYERRKRDIVIASLTRERFGTCWELGCSVGELTAALATRCDRVFATDGAARAVEEARQRVREFPHVQVEQQVHPQDWPNEQFDLIVFSELGYNFEAEILRSFIPRLRDSLLPNGTLLACHWRYPIETCPTPGDEVHRLIAELTGLPRLVQHVEPDFILELWSGDSRSVAALDGIL